MARTELTPTDLVATAGSPPARQALTISADGAYIADPPGPNKIILVVDNSADTAEDITIRAGGSGTTESGGTNPGVPFEQATVGDLVYSSPRATA